MTTTDAEAPPTGRERVHRAALRLFTEHGVSATSLQMIADEMGVTKAAVYYHYRTKDELVVGVVTPFIDRVRDVVELAGRRRGWRAQATVVVEGLVDLIVDVRRLYVVTASDPTVLHLHEHHPRLREVSEQLRSILEGPDADDERRVEVVFFLAGLVGPVGDPSCQGIPDDELRRMLLAIGRRFVLTPSRRRRS